MKGGKVVTATENAGGILGGLSSGMPIVIRVAIKPTPSIAKEQQTVNMFINGKYTNQR
jgi:chorismate synthase